MSLGWNLGCRSMWIHSTHSSVSKVVMEYYGEPFCNNQFELSLCFMYTHMNKVSTSFPIFLKYELLETLIALKNMDAVLKQMHSISFTSWHVTVSDCRGGRIRSSFYTLLQFGGDLDLVKTWECAIHSNAGKDFAVQWINK